MKQKIFKEIKLPKNSDTKNYFPKLGEKHSRPNSIENNLEEIPAQNPIKNKEKKFLKTFNQKKWDEIYEKRFGSKLKEKNEKLEKLRKDKK